ncbi:MAG: ParB N-terminal domain-containing protein [Azonexus sp.]|uniref:ParB/RepB/Spo0J family partition protein n=1 Tax=Azonexus sp. TaxID=1872668 RepID=UPI0028250FB6|nr:ParB N-terminal domain-containing protein [Azonexus sp.]MDR0776226.1 ParB N-terminal domain-containing protein [Azonexus sp.]
MSEATIQKIPLDLLVSSPYNARRFRTEARIQEIAQSLSAHQQREALRVYPGEGEAQGKYLIVSGVTRYLAAKTLGWPTLDAIVDPALNPHDPLTLVSLSRIYNNTAPETDMDRAALVADLEAQGYGKREIMRAMGFNTPRKLLKLKAFKELPPAILDIAAQDPDKISAEFADLLKHAVSTLGEDKALWLTEKTVSEHLSVKKLTESIQKECRKMNSMPAKATKERASQIHYGRAKIGNLCVIRYPGSDKKKVRMEVNLPDNLPEDTAGNFFTELENLVQRMKEQW